jgi:hypothetical protein
METKVDHHSLHIEMLMCANGIFLQNVLDLLSGKLSQTTQSLHVYRSSAHTFQREQWDSESCCVEGGPSERAGSCY